jgi:hypothetical protein
MKRLILGITVVVSTVLSSINFSYAVNRILALDGIDDYVGIPDTDDLSFGDGSNDSPFSISAWLCMDDATLFIIITKYAVGNKEWLFLTDGDDKLEWSLYTLDGTGWIGRKSNTALTSYEGSWIHVVATYDGSGVSSGMKLYLNGVRVDGVDYNGGTYTAMSNGTEDIYIGYHAIGGYYANGKIDEVSIWNIALAPEEIQSIMSTKLHGDEEGLVGYWNFDSSTADDLSPNGNNGTLMGGAQIIPPINRALALDGVDDYIGIPDTDDLSFGDGSNDSPFSISAWVYMDDATQFCIVSKYTAATNLEWAFYTSASDKLSFDCDKSDGTASIGRRYNTAITAYEGQWIHLVATYDGSGSIEGLKIYLNGERVDDTNVPSGSYVAMSNTTSNVTIGDLGSGGYKLNGRIDEVSIWNRALTQMEIWAQKDAILKGDEPGLVGYWRLDEEPGSTIAHDLSGNGNDGTVYGAEFIVSDAPLSTGAIVSISSVSGTKSETVNVPVIVENITSIVSLDLVLSYDADILTPGTAETTDLTTEWQIDSYITPGILKVSIVNQTPPASDGAMINLPFTVNSSAPPACITTPITIDQTWLNEGHIPVITFDGIFSVNGRLGDVSLNGTITGYDAALVLQHTVQIITLSECQQKAADVDKSGEITAYDAAIILQYVVGRISSLPPEGLKSPAITENDAQIVLPYLDFGQNQPIIVPIAIQQKTPLVSAIELTLSCGSLKPIKVQKTELTKSYALAYNIQEGELKIALAGSGPITQNGAFVQVEFEPTSQSLASQLNISHIRLNRNLVRSVVANSNIQMPQITILLQNFPNPFNPETWIPFALSQDAVVTIRIYDIAGRLVRKLELGNKPPGFYISREQSAYWNGRNEAGEQASSGLYFYTLQAGDFTATRKMILVK